MFNTTEPSVAAKQAEEQGFTVEWMHGEAMMMRLTHSLGALRTHPVTGAVTWNNHLAVVHHSGWEDEYAAAYLRPGGSLRWMVQMLGSYVFLRAFGALTELVLGSESLGTQVFYGDDGGEIPAADVLHLRKLIWRNAYVAPWEHGDVVFLDNNRVAHGRQAFEGPRRVLVTWAE